MNIENMTGARWYFSASHNDEVRKELHGHSYVVWAYWSAPPHRDQVVLQEMLKAVVTAGFDHKILPPELGTMEALATAIGGLLSDCRMVLLERPVEGFRVSWQAPAAPRVNVYQRKFIAKCPNNGAEISYELMVGTADKIMVEDIVAETDLITEGYHEDIADRLFARFGGHQVLSAHHHGVDIETVRSG